LGTTGTGTGSGTTGTGSGSSGTGTGSGSASGTGTGSGSAYVTIHYPNLEWTCCNTAPKKSDFLKKCSDAVKTYHIKCDSVVAAEGSARITFTSMNNKGHAKIGEVKTDPAKMKAWWPTRSYDDFTDGTVYEEQEAKPEPEAEDDSNNTTVILIVIGASVVVVAASLLIWGSCKSDDATPQKKPAKVAQRYKPMVRKTSSIHSHALYIPRSLK
jgi:hypothetical protein